MSAPAAAARGAVSRLTPPSISSSTDRPRSSTTRRAVVSLSSTDGMNAWPPKPGWTLMNKRTSISSRYGSTVSTGVSGLWVRPTRIPRSRIRANSGRGSPSSMCTVHPSAPASAKSSRRSPGLSTIRWQSRCRSVRLRSDFTTGGPMVRLGTKWPSITSTWRRSASAATRSTSSASWAKSADRIDGAILFPVTASPYVRPKPQDIHAVGAGIVREQELSPPAAPPGPPRGWVGDELRELVLGPGVDPGRLGARQRANGVDGHAARPHRPRRRPQQVLLQLDQVRHLRGRDAPPQLGPPAHDAEAAARRVHEHAVGEAVAHGQGPAVGHDREDVTETEPIPGAGDEPDAGGLHVARDHAAVADPLGDRGRLAARRGGDVHHRLARTRVEDVHDGLARLVLGRRPTLGDRRHSPRVADPPHEERA